MSQINHSQVEPREISLDNRAQAISALVKAREEKHITLLEFGWVSGVSWDAVRSWVQGRREPTMGNLVAVAQTLGFEIILRPQGGVSPIPTEQQPPIKKRKRARIEPNPNQLNFLDTL